MAKKRRRSAKKSVRKRSSSAAWGHYLFCDSGLSVAYVAKANPDETVEAALFAVDTWCSGLIVCHGCRFETKEAFKEAMQARSRLIKPSTRLRCREEVAYGLAIRRAAEADLPPEFDQWRNLIDPLEDIKLPPYLYRCPECGRGLPEAYMQQILAGIDSRMVFYFPCDRCKRSRAGKPSAKYASTKHIEWIKAIEGIDGFSVTWDQDNTPLLTSMQPGPNYHEALKTMIAEGDVELAACMAIEAHIAHTAVISSAVEDRHVLQALQAVIQGEFVMNDEDADSQIVDSLVRVIKDGIEMFRKEMRFKGRGKRHVRSALERISESVKNHHSRDPRSYINFIKKFTPI